MIKLSTVTLCTAAVLLCSTLTGAAQDVDIEALKKKIQERGGHYAELTALLDNESIDTALAAFDVMMETGNKTLMELAVSSALSAADTRLRARALWEAMSRRENFIVEVDTDALADKDEELKAVQGWFGAQQPFSIVEVFPETQCLSLSSSPSCNPSSNATVSGIKFDLKVRYTVTGSFELGPDGQLHGMISDPDENGATYPARITFR